LWQIRACSLAKGGGQRTARPTCADVSISMSTAISLGATAALAGSKKKADGAQPQTRRVAFGLWPNRVEPQARRYNLDCGDMSPL